MNIVLGSTSTHKQEILRSTLTGKLAYWGIESVEVPSGISDQPLSIEETIQGATSRAKAALAKQPHASLAVGMEGGLENIGGLYNLVCAVAFWDGERLTIGQSGHLPLPHSVSEKIKKGGNFGELIREYQKTAPPEEEERINQLISRELSFTSAINNALSKLGIGHINSLTARTTPQLQPNLIAPKLLKISAALSGFYFIAAPVIILPALALMRIDIYVKLSWLIPLSLILTLLGINLVLFGPNIWRNQEIRRSLVIMIVATLLLLTINIVVLSLIQSVISDINAIGYVATPWVPVIYSIGLTVFGLLGFALRQTGTHSLLPMATIAYLLVGTMGIIQSYWILANLGGVSPFIIPTMLLGLPWSIGLWHLAKELDQIFNPRGVNVSAFTKVDKA